MVHGLKKLPCVYVSELVSTVLYVLLNWVHLCSVADCKNLTSFQNGQVKMPQLAFKSVASFSCNSGYRLLGNGTVVCQESGTWSDIPECQGTLTTDSETVCDITIIMHCS